MQFSILSVLSLAATAIAQSTVVGFNEGTPSVANVGVPVNLPYHAPGPVTITLRQGPANNLNQGVVLVSGATGGNYRWTPAVGGSNFALQITSGSETNYFGPIIVRGSSSSMPSSTSSSTSSADAYGNKVAQTPFAAVNTPIPGSNHPSHLNTTYSGTSTVAGGPAAPTGSANPAPYPVPVPMPGRNSTTPKSSPPSQTDSSAPISSQPASGAAQVGSSFALVVGVFAAFAYLA